MSSLKNPLLASIALMLSGCMVGPNYHGAPVVTPPANAFQRADGATVNAEPTTQWWTALGDPVLNHLIDATLAANPGVAVARARVREARASLRQQTATGLPTTGTTAAYLRTGNVSSLLSSAGSGSSSSSGGSSSSAGNSGTASAGPI